MKVKSQEEINMIKGKFQMGISSREDMKNVLDYIRVLEGLVEEVSRTGFFGADGWEHRLGWTQLNKGE